LAADCTVRGGQRGLDGDILGRPIYPAQQAQVPCLTEEKEKQIHWLWLEEKMGIATTTKPTSSSGREANQNKWAEKGSKAGDREREIKTTMRARISKEKEAGERARERQNEPTQTSGQN
jgi:hypothetical protein